MFARGYDDRLPGVVGPQQRLLLPVHPGVPEGMVIFGDHEQPGAAGFDVEFDMSAAFVVRDLLDVVLRSRVRAVCRKSSRLGLQDHGLIGPEPGFRKQLQDAVFVGFDPVSGRQVEPGQRELVPVDVQAVCDHGRGCVRKGFPGHNVAGVQQIQDGELPEVLGFGHPVVAQHRERFVIVHADPVDDRSFAGAQMRRGNGELRYVQHAVQVGVLFEVTQHAPVDALGRGLQVRVEISEELPVDPPGVEEHQGNKQACEDGRGYAAAQASPRQNGQDGHEQGGKSGAAAEVGRVRLGDADGRFRNIGPEDSGPRVHGALGRQGDAQQKGHREPGAYGEIASRPGRSVGRIEDTLQSDGRENARGEREQKRDHARRAEHLHPGNVSIRVSVHKGMGPESERQGKEKEQEEDSGFSGRGGRAPGRAPRRRERRCRNIRN